MMFEPWRIVALAPTAATSRSARARRWQPGQLAKRSRLADGQYTNFSVRQ